MKKLLLSLTFSLILLSNSLAQVVDYLVPATDLINMTVQTGDMCFDPLEYKQTAPGTVWGFQWTSTNGNTPTSVTVDFVSVSDEGLMIPTTLNGNADVTATMLPSSCGFTGQLFSMNPANYTPLGVNTVLLDYTASVVTAQLYPVIGSYVHIEVNYGTVCTDPDVPTLTASSPICPSSSVTINIGGNLNDATGWVVYTGSCGGTVDGGSATSTYVASPASTTTYYIRGEGACVTPGTCASITITVDDSQAPAPDNATLGDINAECSSTPTAPTATDNCAGAITGTPDVIFPITTQGTTVVTWTYDDGNGNISTQTQNVIIDDITGPSISCPANTTVSNNLGTCGAPVTYSTPVGTDNCTGSSTTMTAGLASGSTFPVGTTTVTYEVTDVGSNTAQCSFDVTVNDTETPTVVCPPNITVFNDPGICGAIINYTAPVGTDNCPGATTSLIAGLSSGSTFPVGNTNVMYEVVDLSGNLMICDFDITVIDNEAPTITQCPGSSSYPADNAGCTSQIVWLDPFANDNCGIMSFTPDIPSGSTFSLGTTTVTYTATDNSGNIATCAFDITIISDLSVMTVPTDLLCNGNNSGDINATVTGGTPGYTYDWNSGAYTTEDLSGVGAGTYNLTVADANGCTAMTTEILNEPSAITVTVDSEVDPSGCGATDGSIDVTVSGGIPPYTYDWNSGAYTTEDLSGIGGGAYNLTVTDANGCTQTASASLSDAGAPAIVVDSTSDASCIGEMDGAIYVSVSGGTMPYTYDWNSGTYTTEDITGLGAGTYSITATDGAGCTASLNQTINEPAALDISVNQNGADLMANATGVTYQWIDCGTMSPIVGETNATFTATSNGDFAVIITDGPCSDTSSCYTVGGIGFDEYVQAVNVYPNPSTGLFNLQLTGFSGTVQIQVFDLGGKAVYFSSLLNQNQVIELDLTELEKGTYVLQVNSNEKINTTLLIIH